jgi:hypothetical protein
MSISQAKTCHRSKQGDLGDDRPCTFARENDAYHGRERLKARLRVTDSFGSDLALPQAALVLLASISATVSMHV